MADVKLSKVKKVPDTLYDVCLTKLVLNAKNGQSDKNEFHLLPDTVHWDLYFKMYEMKKICMLYSHLGDLKVFDRILRTCSDTTKILQCFQALMDHDSLNSLLAQQYLHECDLYSKNVKRKTETDRRHIIETGLRLGSFLNEAFWFEHAESILLSCRYICLSSPMNTFNLRLTLECCQRLLHCQSSYCCFPAAAETYSLSLRLLGYGHMSDDQSMEHSLGHSIQMPAPSVSKSTQTEVNNALDSLSDDVKDWRLTNESAVTAKAMDGLGNLLIRLYKEFSLLFYSRCDYNEAYRWGAEALKMLTPSTPSRIVVETLRACGKACVVKRRFAIAGRLLSCAEKMARVSPLLQAHTRSDLAFYLNSADCIERSVQVYEEALNTLISVYGRRSLATALAQEDLAYALYVLEYCSGRFYMARTHSEKAINTLQELLPSDHLLLASAKRVKALILEEIALDIHDRLDNTAEPSLLDESEELHMAALKLSILAFGEKNVQTAKHYGNLGRLYQSMHRFDDAEKMHLKAIAIKEELLGVDDYEVGLSIGHLASLYNYHMRLHEQAEKLYFRSISISLKLFGEQYSGLEYDYRGLVHVFTQLKLHDRAATYIELLQRWYDLREQLKGQEESNLSEQLPIDIEQLKKAYFDPNTD